MVELPVLASKQAASKQQHHHQAPSTHEMGRNEIKKLCCGALDSAEILVDDTYGCEIQSHKV